MPYRELPDDFREAHPSVWVDIDSRLFDPARAHVFYNEFMDELEYAAEVGFDAVCVNEHHANGYGLMPSPNVIAGSLVRRTSDAMICVLGNSIALYNPPLRVAEELAMLDCISGGRLIAGFPLGTPMDTCYAYGQNPSMLRQRYEEAHDLIMQAWRRQQPFAFNGRFNQQRYVNVWPRPLQQPHPPVWIPGGGAQETWRFCGQHDYVYCALSYFGYKAGLGVMNGYWQTMEEMGRDRNPFRAGFLQVVGVAETRAEALQLSKDPAEYFYGRCLHVDPRYANPPGYATETTLRFRFNQQQGQHPLANFGKVPDFDTILERGYLIIGSPDEVADRLRDIALNLNVGQLMALLQFGNMGSELTRYNTRLFAEQVMPQLKDLFTDQWEDRWWPKPLAKQQRVQPQRMAS
jgi:alkanesulfonate monooxygenase SsuD/methylene tetrahydromethanopterin reductase-like flavin-dependent oxidoreductase (luciferase family)